MGRLLATLVAVVVAMAGAARAQQVDPKLAASWAYLQQGLPEVSYDLLASACAEGKLMIYYGTWIDAEDKRIAAFRKRFPCLDIGKFTANTGERRERWLAETRAGRHLADIIQDTEPGVLDDQARSGLLMQYVITSDDQFGSGAKNSGYWYAMRAALVGIAWNTDLVTDADARVLSQWSGIIDPRWAGRAGVVDPSAGGVAYLPWYLWQKLYGTAFLEKVGQLKPRVIASINPAAAALASGDIAVLFNASETGLLPLQERGAPIRWSMPEPGIGPMTGQAISATAPHPNAAKLYQEYSFGTEGYGIWQKDGGAPARIGFKDQRAVAAESWYKPPTAFADYDTKDATAKQDEIFEIYYKTIGRLKK
jgi:ABC-type Fe3+ transport system substrate-binding protein